MSAHRIDQLLAGFREGDAISQDALLLQEAMRGAGFDSEIFVPPERVDPRAAALCRPLADYAGRAGDAAVYHYSIASPATAVFRSTAARKVVRYHNITPAGFFAGFDDGMAAQLREARGGLAGVVRAADATWAASAFNAAEVQALGVERVDVLPILFSPRRFEVPPDPDVAARLAGPVTSVLFVGRIAPNKRVEELLHAFAWYRRTLNPFSRLVLAGSDRSCPRYSAMLRMLTLWWDLPNVCFEGFVSEAGLAACYAAADLFVCASDHEGYCLPLLEAMHHDVPVIAKDAGAMPETLDGAGVLYSGLTPPELAELMHRAIGDEALRGEVLASQRRRMQAAYARDAAGEVRRLLAALWV